MVSSPDPKLKERAILTLVNKLQTHAGNLEKKKEAFTEADAVVSGGERAADLNVNAGIFGEDGEVKPRVGRRDTGPAIVIGVTEGGAGTGTTYTVYYNQSEAEIADANKKHDGYVTEVSLLKSGKSSINRLTDVVTKDSDYVNAVETSANAYLKSTIYADTLNRVEKLNSDQNEIAVILEQKVNKATIVATDEEIDALDVEKVTADEDESRQRTINVFWGQAESSDSTRILSNLAPRTFTYQEREYGSVEHAYQSNKSGTFDQATYDEYDKINGFGRKIQGKGTTDELKAADSLGLMKELVVESFKQNPDSEAAAKLMQYENFTHNNNELIDRAFLDGLKLAQESLRESVQIAADTNVTDTDSQTTPTEEASPEGTPVTPQEETTEGSSAEIRAEIAALNLKLEEAEAREKAQAAEQEAAPVDTATEETTPPVTEESAVEEDTIATETVSDVNDTAAETTEEELTTYNNIKVVNSDNIINAEGQKGAAQYDRETKIITIDRSFLQIKFAEKAWTKMRELIENVHGEKITSKAENLPADSFSTYNEFEKFVIEHEYQHSVYTREDFDKDFPNGTKGEYETITNDRALAAIQQATQQSSEVSFKLDNNLSLQESELDVHTLSVLFPAVINADGTLKAGDTAINKLGKFLKVCK